MTAAWIAFWTAGVAYLILCTVLRARARRHFRGPDALADDEHHAQDPEMYTPEGRRRLRQFDAFAGLGLLALIAWYVVLVWPGA